MFTGNNEAVTRRIAGKTGVDEVRPKLLPAAKVVSTEALVSKYGHMAMVVDGITDAPVMAQACLGITMGAVGSNTAIKAADIALMSDDLAKLPWLIRHSRRYGSIPASNLHWVGLLKTRGS
jgi:Cd2+/Zn2+-exporting ATPase